MKLSHSSKILIIRRDNIGDAVCTIPIIIALRTAFPDSEIRVLTSFYTADVFDGIAEIDQLIVYTKTKHSKNFAHQFINSLRRFFSLYRLRRWRPDLAIITKSSYDPLAIQHARFTKSRTIVGFGPPTPAPQLPLPTLSVVQPDMNSLHEIEALQKLVEPLGVKYAPIRLYLKADDDLFKKYTKISPPGYVRVALHISAREPERRWGVEKFKYLAEIILKEVKNCHIYLLWSPGNSVSKGHPGDDVAANYLSTSIVNASFIPVKTTTVRELKAILSCCDIFVGCDGGALHLAAGFNKRIVGLYQNKKSKLVHWRPWCSHYSIIPGLEESIEEIPVMTVAHAVFSHVSKLKNQPSSTSE